MKTWVIGNLSFFRLEREKVAPWFGRSRTWPSSLTGRAIARKASGPGFDSRLGCGGHFFLSSRPSLSSFYFKIFSLHSPRVFFPKEKKTYVCMYCSVRDRCCGGGWWIFFSVIIIKIIIFFRMRKLHCSVFIVLSIGALTPQAHSHVRYPDDGPGPKIW